MRGGTIYQKEGLGRKKRKGGSDPKQKGRDESTGKNIKGGRKM